MKPLSGVFLHGPTHFQYFNKGVLDFLVDESLHYITCISYLS